MCGVPIHEEASTCEERRLWAIERMLRLRKSLASTVSDPECVLPCSYRVLN